MKEHAKSWAVIGCTRGLTASADVAHISGECERFQTAAFWVRHDQQLSSELNELKHFIQVNQKHWDGIFMIGRLKLSINPSVLKTSGTHTHTHIHTDYLRIQIVPYAYGMLLLSFLSDIFSSLVI